MYVSSAAPLLRTRGGRNLLSPAGLESADVKTKSASLISQVGKQLETAIKSTSAVNFTQEQRAEVTRKFRAAQTALFELERALLQVLE
jgi:hypothetical protein